MNNALSIDTNKEKSSEKTEKLSILIIDDEPSDIKNVITPSFIDNTLLKDISEIYVYNSIGEAKKNLSDKIIENIDFLFLDQMFEKELGDEHDEDEVIKTLVPIVITNYPFCRTIILSKHGNKSKKPHKFFCDSKYYFPYPRKEYGFKHADEVIRKEFSDWNKSLLLQLNYDEYEKIRDFISKGEKNDLQIGGRSFTINTFFKHLECGQSILPEKIISYLYELPILNIDNWGTPSEKYYKLPLKDYVNECFTNPKWVEELKKGEGYLRKYIESYTLFNYSNLDKESKKEQKRIIIRLMNNIEWGHTAILDDFRNGSWVISEFIDRIIIRRAIAILYFLFEKPFNEIYSVIKYGTPDALIDDEITERTYKNPIRYNLFMPFSKWKDTNDSKRKNADCYDNILFHEDRLFIKSVYEQLINHKDIKEEAKKLLKNSWENINAFDKSSEKADRKQIKTRNKFSWLHISDLHFQKGGEADIKWNNFCDFIEQNDNLRSCSYVFYTGDIGHQGEFYDIVKARLIQLQKSFDPNKYPMFFWSFGNHDISFEKNNSNSQKDRKEHIELTIWGKDKKYSLPYERFKKDIQSTTFSPLLQSGFIIPKNLAVDVSINMGLEYDSLGLNGFYSDTNINVCVLNTSIVATDETAKGRLFVAIDELSNRMRSFDNHKPTFVLAHHPFTYLEDTNEQHLKTALVQADIYLCGHEHKPSAKRIPQGRNRSLFEIVAGSVSGVWEDLTVENARSNLIYGLYDGEGGINIHCYTKNRYDWEEDLIENNYLHNSLTDNEQIVIKRLLNVLDIHE